MRNFFSKKNTPSASDLRRTKAVNGDLVLPLKEFVEVASNLGFFSADPDPDGVMRRLPLVYRLGELFLPSLSLSAAALYFGATPALIADPTFEDGLIRVGFPAEGGKIVEVPVDPSGALRVNYYGPAGASNPEVPAAQRGAFPRVSLADVAAGKFDPASVKGKIVLVAVTAIGTFDQRVTPFSPIAPGVEIHAAAIQNMISGSALDRPELHLQLERHLGDLVQEERAAVRALEITDPASVGTREAALLVTE